MYFPFERALMAEETERVTVSTYVPAYQREEWRKHADRLDMSQSEFVRTMVQAGRRGFDLRDEPRDPEEVDVPDADPRGCDLKTEVLEIVDKEGPLEWDELVYELNGDFEENLETTIQSEKRITYSGPKGGYVLVEGVDGE